MNESLETQVAVLVERVNNMLDQMEKDQDKTEELEKRVKDLEQARAYIVGAGAFAGAILGWLGNLALSLLTK